MSLDYCIVSLTAMLPLRPGKTQMEAIPQYYNKQNSRQNLFSLIV